MRQYTEDNDGNQACATKYLHIDCSRRLLLLQVGFVLQSF